MAQIAVVIYPAGGDTQRLKRYFSDSKFGLVDYAPLIETDNPIVTEKLWIQGALKKSLEEYPGLPCIIVKDTSITNFNSSSIAQICSHSELASLDLFYLCKWEDLCNLYQPLSTNIGRSTQNYYRTYSPRGNQCMYYSSKGIDNVLDSDVFNQNSSNYADTWYEKVMNMMIADGDVVAATTLGNIFDFDVVKYGQSNNEFTTMSECIQNPGNVTDGVSPSIYIYAIGIIILILIIAWALYKIGPKEVRREFKSPIDSQREGINNKMSGREIEDGMKLG